LNEVLRSNINFASNITFTAAGVEVLRLESNGNAYVHGRFVDNDRTVYDAFCEWLRLSYANVNVQPPDFG